jgi:molybdopterin converting factor subunit 1
MKVEVLLFASYADVLGRSSVAVDVPSRATVGDVMARLMRLPGAERLPPTPMVAVNQRYAGLDQRVSAHDEVAIIPPVAGG